jgi:hypothetical protein
MAWTPCLARLRGRALKRRRELNNGNPVYGLPGWQRNTQWDLATPIQTRL